MQTVAADDGAAGLGQLALEALGVVERRDDQHGVAREGVAEAVQDQPVRPEFGGPTISESVICPTVVRITHGNSAVGFGVGERLYICPGSHNPSHRTRRET